MAQALDLFGFLIYYPLREMLLDYADLAIRLRILECGYCNIVCLAVPMAGA
jgi:hypothetical protein